MPADTDESLHFGRFRLDLVQHRLYRDGQPVALEPLPFTLLVHLRKNPNRHFTNEQLKLDVWKSNVTDGAIREAVGKIRTVLHPYGRCIEGRDKGYYFDLACFMESSDHETTPHFGRLLPPERTSYRLEDEAAGALPFRALHQAPRAPGDMTGRSEELQELIDHVARNSADLIGLYGMGGVGKTALALKMIEAISRRYDADFCVDLMGLSQSALSPATAMAYVIKAYYPGTSLPRDEHEIAGLYHSVLHDKRAIILLDNARDARQITPLVPPEGNLLIVTSRALISAPGLYSLAVHDLPVEDAEALLLKIAPRIEEYSKTLATLCGYLPLALRACASTLACTPELRPPEYAEQLRNVRSRLNLTDPSTDLTVESSLRLSYDFLGTDDLRRRLCSLSVFPISFDQPAASAVWSLDSTSTAAALAALNRHSLLQYDSNSNRYRLHDLIRAFGLFRLSRPEELSARRNHSLHFKEVLSKATALYDRGHDDTYRGLELAELEWGNIEAGWEWARSHVDDDDAAAGLASTYPEAGWSYLQFRQHPIDRITVRTVAQNAAVGLQDRRAEGVHLGNLGLAYADLGDMRRAIEYYELSLAIAREVSDRRSEGIWLGNLGIAYSRLGDPSRAISEYYPEALSIARDIGDRRNEAMWLGNLGLAYEDLGDLTTAVKYYREELALNRQIGHLRGERMALHVLGMAEVALHEIEKAIEHHELARKIARDIGDRRGEGYALGALGTDHAALGRTDMSLDYQEQALLIFRETSDRRNEGWALFSIGVAQHKAGNRDVAIRYLQSALTVWEPIDDPRALKAKNILNEWLDL